MSRYSKLLNKIIAESGYTSKEVVEKCNEIGNNIDTTRMSKLQNGKLPAPSDKVSRDIAKVCNADERLLVLEGYIEKAPKEITDVFQILRKNATIASTKAFKNVLTEQEIKLMLEAIEGEPLSDLIVGILDSSNDQINITSTGYKIETNDFSFSLDEPISFKVNDDSMSPILNNGARVITELQENYSDGDILAIKVKGQDEPIFRYALFLGDNITLTSLNKNFKPQTYNKNDIVNLGRVTKVTTNI